MQIRERTGIARAIAERIVEKYGDEVLLVAVYGSVATGEDAEHACWRKSNSKRGDSHGCRVV